MDKDRRDLFILGGISVVLIVLLVFSAVKFKIDTDRENSTNHNSNIQDNGTENDENSDVDDVVVPSSTPGDTSNPSPSPVPTKTPELPNAPTSSPTATPSIEPIYGENEVVSYFTSLEASAFSSDEVSFKDKAKNAFTTIVDFLFYDSEIKGYTFSELTSSAKLKIIKIALSIDNKIDELFPDYKNTIKEKMTNLKGKAALLYLETTSKLCESVGEDACDEARRDFKNMKESFGFTWELIKSGASQGYNHLKEILDEWYQSIR